MTYRSHRILVFCALAAVVLTVAPALVAQEGKAPDIEILERVYDAGEVMKGDKINHVFKVKNTGNAPLQIFDARPSCGCTVASFDRTIMPGEVGKIEATIDTNRIGTGQQTKTVRVQSNDPDEGSVVLQLKSNVLSLATAIPPRLFIRADRMKAEDTAFLLRPHDSNPFRVKAVRSDIDFLGFEVKEVEEAETGGRGTVARQAQKGDFKIEVDLGKNPPIGDVNGTITVMTTSRKTPEVEIPVQGTITGLITAIPRRVYLRISEPRPVLAATKDVKLRREPSIQSPEVGEIAEGEQLETLPKPRNLDPKDEWVRVRSQSQRRVGYVYKKFTKEVQGETQGGAQSSRSHTIQVVKRQGDPFQIREVRTTLPGVSAELTTVEEGRRYNLTVTYDGELDRGSHRGEVEIKTTDKDEPTVKIPLYVHVT